MIFDDDDIDTMLSATGTTAVLDDGSLQGLTLYAKFRDPQQVIGEFSMQVELSDPSCKVRTSAIDHLATSIRGRQITIRGTDYRVKTADPRGSGMTVLSLELDQ